MKVSVWLVTRERETWITSAEILCVGCLLVVPAGPLVHVLLGFPLLAHIGYKALTSLPMGRVPRRPERGQPRRRYDLRARVVRFLDEVKRVEDYANRADLAELPEREVKEFLFVAQRRVMAAAREVAKQTGQSVIRA